MEQKLIDRINELVKKPTGEYTQLDIDKIILALNWIADELPKAKKQLLVVENDMKQLEAVRTLELKTDKDITLPEVKSKIQIEKQDLIADSLIYEFTVNILKLKYEVLLNKLVQVRQYLKTEIDLVPTL